MDVFFQDLRYSLRMFVKNPGFTAVAVLALMLGIGANTAIFSLLDAVLLRPLALSEPERLVTVWGHHAEIGRETASLPDFDDWRRQSLSFEGLAAMHGRSLNLTGSGEPERLRGLGVTSNLLSVLGVHPALGRSFLPEEDRPGAEPVALISDGLWRRRFGADPGVVGRSVMVNGAATTVLGVLPAELPFPRASEMWVPLAMDPAQAGRRSDFLLVLGRLAPGVSHEAAHSEMAGIMRRLEETYPQTNAGWGIEILSLHDYLIGSSRTALWVFAGAVGFVLLIACANVANLMLTRATARSREMAIRTAVGAAPWRIVRQLLTESVLLAFVGAALGVLLAVWSLELLVYLRPEAVPPFAKVGVDLRILGFTLGLTVLTGLLFGMVPALQAARPELSTVLKEGGRSGSAGARRGRLRSGLAAAEIALALVLLVGAGLLLKSFVRLTHVDPGFDPRGILLAQLNLPASSYAEDAKLTAFSRGIHERLGALPGAEAAALTSSVPLVGGAYYSFRIDGEPEPPPQTVQDAESFVVSPGYFGALRIPLLQGRDFDAVLDAEQAPRAAIVSQTLARRYFPDADPIGRRISTEGPREEAWMTIVGVVGDTRNRGLGEDVYPQLYAPLAQVPRRSMTLVVRTPGDPAALSGAVRAAVAAMDPELPVYGISTMDGVVAESVAGQQFNMLLIGVFGAVALLLASIGIYGVLSYSVAQRTHELGIRMALGAGRREILMLVLRQGMRLALVGVAVGLAASLAVTRVLSGLLYGVAAVDLPTFGSVAALLVAVALLACSLPAWRAMKVSPLAALHEE
jgi:putative ABC transport system permease protein